MTTAAVATATSPLWFATRATGLTALVLLTVSVVFGILTSVRFARPAWPRFVTVSLHRNLSLLVLTFTGLHVLTTVTDPYASISVVSAVLPFSSGYRRIWLGLGAVAFDLLLAVLVTSLLRVRLGQRTWRLVHWAGYLCWPVALIHGIGTGTDGAARWVLAVTAACALAVAAAGAWRLAVGWPAHAALRDAGRPARGQQRGTGSRPRTFGKICFSCPPIPDRCHGDGNQPARAGQREPYGHHRHSVGDRRAAADRRLRTRGARRRRDDGQPGQPRAARGSGAVHRAPGEPERDRDAGRCLRGRPAAGARHRPRPIRHRRDRDASGRSGTSTSGRTANRRGR